MKLKILTDTLLEEFVTLTKDFSLAILKEQEKAKLPVDYFQFYKSMSSVYSSKIEGEDIDFDSYFKHKFLGVQFKSDYTRKADDLYLAYEFIENNALTLENVQKAHSLLSSNLLPANQQGLIRHNSMFVLNSKDQIEYVAAPANILETELDKLFSDISFLLTKELSTQEVFYYASLIHLVFVKIHPFQDGNGRAARLIEKWFLYAKFGSLATSVQLEKNYYKNLENYYLNIKVLGLEYEELNYERALNFLLMTIKGIGKE
ncbi:MAG: hypothetical protein GKR88_02585 [Flavobacteriaceae bacterium]|nr:MAG: hypothetical protein GKR88_02585 [Flavobacteriaceae bacterium]